MVPDYANPQDLNRYAYVRGNPVRFNDPSGHFEEEELKNWFGGEEWYKQFSSEWVHLLRLAELGDAVLSTEDNSTPFIFAMDDNRLSLWNVGTKTAYSVGEVAANNTDVSLYRPKAANQTGGTSFGLGENIMPELGNNNDGNIYCPLNGCNKVNQLSLPSDWYIGTSNYVKTTSIFKPDYKSILGSGLSALGVWRTFQAAKEGGAGTPDMIIAGLTVAVVVYTADSILQFDTDYSIVPGHGTPPVYSVPSPYDN